MINSIRGQCAEFGVIAPQNRAGQLIEVIRDDDDDRLLAEARLATLVDDQSWQKIAELAYGTATARSANNSRRSRASAPPPR